MHEFYERRARFTLPSEMIFTVFNKKCNGCVHKIEKRMESVRKRHRGKERSERINKNRTFTEKKNLKTEKQFVLPLTTHACMFFEEEKTL